MVQSHLCFETLSNELRMQILERLKESPSNVEQLAQSLNAERSRVSHSLRMLLTCGYVSAERRGKERVYSIQSHITEGYGAEESGSVLNRMRLHVEHVCHNDCKKLQELKAQSH